MTPLLAKPADEEAVILQREATGLNIIQGANKLAQAGDFIGGDKELTRALILLPDNAEAKQLLSDYKQRESAQLEKQRIVRLNRPREVFDMALKGNATPNYLMNMSLKTGKKFDATAAAIVTALQSVQPPFKIVEFSSPAPETCEIEATLEKVGFWVKEQPAESASARLSADKSRIMNPKFIQSLGI